MESYTVFILECFDLLLEVEHFLSESVDGLRIVTIALNRLDSFFVFLFDLLIVLGLASQTHKILIDILNRVLQVGDLI
jgi:hypothetical protein